MKHPTALLIKFFLVTGVLWVMLGIFFDVSFWNVITLSVILTLVSFFGDVYILPRIGTILGVIGDFALALLLIWMIGAYFFTDSINWSMAALSSAIVIALAEISFHRMMAEKSGAKLIQTRPLACRQNQERSSTFLKAKKTYKTIVLLFKILLHSP